MASDRVTCMQSACTVTCSTSCDTKPLCVPLRTIMFPLWLLYTWKQFSKCRVLIFFSFCFCFRYKFDDERVTKEDTKKALEEQYGGEEEVIFFINSSSSIWPVGSRDFAHLLCVWHLRLSFVFFWREQLPQVNPGFNNTPFKFTKYSNAYMLVYIRESDKEKIMCNVDEKDIAEHLRVSHYILLSF